MNCEWKRMLVIVLSVSAVILLGFPIMEFQPDGDGVAMVIRGYNLVEFSSWGSLFVSTPIILIALLYSRLNRSYKTVGLIFLYLMNLVSAYNSFTYAYKWAESVASGFIRTYYRFFLLDVFVIIFALVAFFIYNEFGDADEDLEETCI